MGQIPPDWEWTDAFGDTMQFNRAGENVVLTVVRRRDGDDYDHAYVSLNPAQQRALRAALFGIGTKRREQNFGPDIRTDFRHAQHG